MRRYGLLGRTLSYSFSKGYFAKKFADEGITDASYENFELPSIQGFPQLLSSFSDLKGLNVTIPYKEEVLPFLAEQDESVKAIGACNCIKLDNGRLTGYNTDAAGFQNSVKPQLKPHHKKALVLGTGGASKAVCHALEKLGIAYRLVSRQPANNRLGYEDINEGILSEHHLIINTTPVGTFPNVDEALPLPYRLLTPGHFLFDLVYNPAKTMFLSEGERRGAQIANGYQMLVGQAEESWRIWNQP